MWVSEYVGAQKHADGGKCPGGAGVLDLENKKRSKRINKDLFLPWRMLRRREWEGKRVSFEKRGIPHDSQ
jgi:hypothetical protein